MTTPPDQHDNLPHRFRLSRRAAVLAGAAGVASVATAARIAAQVATPGATPVASPGASPEASPVASPIASPAATPEPVYPLAIIDDQRPEWAGTPQTGGDLRLFVRGEGLQTFIPTVFQQDFQVSVSYLDPLIWVDEVTLEPRPWIATGWSWSSDGLALAIDLRRDVTWHDGSPLTAEDVRFSYICYRDDYDSAVSFMLAVVADITVINDWKLTIHFDEPDGTFPFNAGNLPIFSRAQYESHWNAMPLGERTLSGFDYGDRQPLGTGPWVIDDRSDSEIRFTRNEGHFAAVPLADTLTLSVEDDGERQLDAWRDDKVELIWPVAGDTVEDLLNDKGSLVAADSTLSYFAAFNFGNPLRADPGLMASPGLREALSRAINREAYAESIFGGFIDVERAGFMTQPWAIDPKVVNPKHDVGAARKVLEDNGWADFDGDGILDSPAGDRGAFVCIVRDDAEPGLLAILDTLNGNFNEIGFLLEVQRLSPDEFIARWTTTFDYDLIAISLSQYAAFSEFDLVGSAWSIRRNAAGWNPGGYFSAEVDDAILAYFAAWEVDDLKAALGTIQRVTNDDPFALWLGFPQQPVLIRPDVSGFQPNKMWQSWNTWSLWHGAEASVVTPIPSTPEPATPQATPVAGTPDASPVVATPVASPDSTPDASPVD